MAVGEPSALVPHPDGVADGSLFPGSNEPTTELDGCTVYTEPGATESQTTLVHHDGETVVLDFVPCTHIRGAEACPAPGADAVQMQRDGDASVGIFRGRTSRRVGTLFLSSYTQGGGVIHVFEEGDGLDILSVGAWDVEIEPTVIVPNTLVFDAYHGSPEEAGVACTPTPDGMPPFVVERTEIDLGTRVRTAGGARCIQ